MKKIILSITLIMMAVLVTVSPALAYQISSPYGWRIHPISNKAHFHTGVDLALPYGAPIGSLSDGVVIYAGPKGGYGNTVIVKNKDGSQSLYAHGSKINVTVGQQVTKGQVIGEVGSSGNSTGPHLHMELKINGVLANPTLLLGTMGASYGTGSGPGTGAGQSITLPTGTPAEYDVLNKILIEFQSAIFGNVGVLKNAALALFGLLALLDLVLAVLLNLGEVDHIKQLIVKILKYGLVYWAILNYVWLINTLFQGFIWVGIAGGSTATGLELLGDPTKFAEIGGRLCSFIFNGAVLLAAPEIAVVYLILGLTIFMAFTLIAINFLLTYLEFYVLAILSLIFIPFGANKYTSWITQKVGNMMFTFGVKIMVLAFLASVAIPIAENWAVPNFNLMNPGATINSLLYMTCGAVALAVLAWHAPSLAASLVNGSPGLDFNNAVVQPTMMVGGMAALATTGGISGAVTQATKAAANVSGAAGGSAGNASAAGSGGGGQSGVKMASTILGSNGSPYRGSQT